MIDTQEHSKRIQGQRLKQLYKKLRLTQAALAQIGGTDQESISMAVNGKRNVQEVWLYKLKEIYSSVNIEWVLSGEGEMLTENDMVLEEPRAEYVPSRLTCEEVTTAIARLQLRVMELESRVLELEGRVKGG